MEWIEKLKDILKCPICGGNFEIGIKKITCKVCKKNYKVENNILVFLEE
ncbi:hypothetical protein Mevan_1485 [Methanococcus vannielii SB]|uniref:Trm112 family protein n=1 Tax=Methanococcus vannielii (strain ATCC 35089 / DSM 1224 / JCM 13029 / OCM 148 / SB) TaxID=406327 RepID=A6USA7_METVS|nr:hypothetical protein [Methanococcus vannielii]ABR55379.1 hypothetical protein Mevan_1485 [Methanococcus vannielii SB]